jgi:hypothetical protein
VTVRKHYRILESDEEVYELSQTPTYSVVKELGKSRSEFPNSIM